MILGIIESIDKFVSPVKEWMIKNSGNPFVMLGLFLLGLAVFLFTYNALHKDK